MSVHRSILTSLTLGATSTVDSPRSSRAPGSSWASAVADCNDSEGDCGGGWGCSRSGGVEDIYDYGDGDGGDPNTKTTSGVASGAHVQERVPSTAVVVTRNAKMIGGRVMYKVMALALRKASR